MQSTIFKVRLLPPWTPTAAHDLTLLPLRLPLLSDLHDQALSHATLSSLRLRREDFGRGSSACFELPSEAHVELD